jgi:hypothetical protein
MYKRRYIQIKETLIVGEISNFITKREGSSYKNGDMAAKKVRVNKRYRCYSEVKHNTRTYIADIEQLDNSNSFKE